MSTVVLTPRCCHIYGYSSSTLLGIATKKPEHAAPVFAGSTICFYCPELATAGVMFSGRLSSSVSSVPAISVAERCLLSQ